MQQIFNNVYSNPLKQYQILNNLEDSKYDYYKAISQGNEGLSLSAYWLTAMEIFLILKLWAEALMLLRNTTMHRQSMKILLSS